MSKFQIESIREIPILKNKEAAISSVADALDLMAEVGVNFEADRLIIFDTAFSEDFFDLSTGLLGEILQKYANYYFKLAIVGDFSKYSSKVLPDFIRESNQGKQFFFVETVDEAVNLLQKQ